MSFKSALTDIFAATPFASVRGITLCLFFASLIAVTPCAQAAVDYGPVHFNPIYTVNPDGSTRLISPGSDGSTDIPAFVTPPSGVISGSTTTPTTTGTTQPTTTGSTTGTSTGTTTLNNAPLLNSDMTANTLNGALTQTSDNLNPTVNTSNTPSTTVIGATNPYCNQQFAAAFDAARQKALTVQLSRDNEFFKYQIAGAFAANCVGKLIGYASALADGVASVQTAATAGNPVQAIVAVIAHRILHAVLQQLINNLENQICSITTQLTSAMESLVQNAICIPSGDLQLGGLFSFNLNLNLPNLQCDGIAINPLQLTEINPATGQPYAQGEASYAAGTLSTYGAGGMSTAADNGGPPDQRDDYLWGTSATISGEVDTNAGDATGVVGAVGTVSSSSTYTCFDMDKAINYALSHATNGYQGNPPNGNCAYGVRMALCAGGMSQFCVGGHGNAKDYGPSLVAAGYVKVGDENSGNINVQPGCIIIDAATSSHPYGHIQMFAGGSTWVSDFTTSNMYGGTSYANNKNFDMYCPSPQLNQSSNGSCK